MSKYGNRKVEMDGMIFDSKHEVYRWIELKYMERAGMIRNLERQVPFTLIPSQKDENGKVIEREVRYIADFTYLQHINGDGWVLVVEDAKSKATRTKEYIIKRKLMLHKHGIRIQEV